MGDKLTKENDASDFLSKKIYRPLADGFAKKLLNMSITPNQITLTGFLIGILASYFFFIDLPIMGVILFQIWILSDYLDGSLARLKNRSTKRGEYFDPLLDRLSEAIIYLSICWGQGELIFVILYMWIVIHIVHWYHNAGRTYFDDINQKELPTKKSIMSCLAPYVKYINLELGRTRDLLICVGAIEKSLLLPIMVIILTFDLLLLFGKMVLGYIYIPNTPK